MSFSFFVDIFKNVSLVCTLHTSHVTPSMTLIVIIAQGISLVQISSSHHFQKMRYLCGGGGPGVYTLPPTSQIIPCMLTTVAKSCTFKKKQNTLRSFLSSSVVVLPCSFTEGSILDISKIHLSYKF